ncbi:MAG: AMP-binding protein [Flavobacteriales bacterium]
MRFDIVTGRFEELDQATGKLALAGSDRDLSWSALRDEVQQLSSLITDLALPKGHPIMVYGHKRAAMVVAVLACISNDHPYIPVDTVVPMERVKRILAITRTQVLINCTGEALALDAAIMISEGIVQRVGQPDFSESIPFRSDDPIRYIIFTSGSTGEPKGVQITREAAASFLRWMTNDFRFGAKDVFINQAPFSFDLSVYELFTALHLGGTLLLNDAATCKDSQRFMARLAHYGGSVWVSTPTFAYLYLTEPAFVERTLPTLHSFLFCGEALPKMTAQRLLDRFPSSRVLNTYGPTEATVATTLIDVTRDLLAKYPDMPVGYSKPEGDVRTNPEGTRDEPGEIEIIGPHVSIGYFKDADLNAGKFFTVDGQRAFRTGDYGYIQDGILFFNGRRDEQVKLNGFRIELGDITAQMLAVPGVADAIAVPLKAGEVVKRIIGFVRAQPGSDNEQVRAGILARLKKELPEYMVPGDIAFVDAFPVNTSHKTDRKALIEGYLKR